MTTKNYTPRPIKFIPPSRFANKTGKIIEEEKLKNTNYTIYYVELDEPDNPDEKIVATLINYVSFIQAPRDTPSEQIVQDYHHKDV